MSGEHWKNGEGYHDPTSGKAIDTIERKTKKKATARDKVVTNVIESIKAMLNAFDLELIERVKIKDRKTNKEYM